MTVEEALAKASGMLKKKVSRPRLEAEILLAHFLDFERIEIHLASRETLESSESYFELVRRRVCGEPIEYITGKVSFYDIELEVGPGVLIARPETEILVDIAAKIIQTENIVTVAEIGVGSGAISIMLARKFSDLCIIATDISEKALFYAKKNIERYALSDRIELINGDLLEGVEKKIDMVVSNPPYICEKFELPPPLKYEPKSALIGGESGDELLKKIINISKEKNIPHLLCEMGYDQRRSIETYCKYKKLPSPDFYKDLAGLDRGFYLNMKEKE